MLTFIRDIILSDILILIVLIGTFLAVSNWALFRLKEYLGYALGMVVALLVIIIISSLMPNAVVAQDLNVNTTLNFFQIIFASFLGLIIGGGSMILSRFGRGQQVQQSLKVAIFVFLNVLLLFLMLISPPDTRRMIGIFALAFGSAALFVMVLMRGWTRQQAFTSQGADPLGPGAGGGRSRLDQMRDEMRGRDGDR